MSDPAPGARTNDSSFPADPASAGPIARPIDEQPAPGDPIAPEPRDVAGKARRRPWGLALLALLLIAGFILERGGILDGRAGLELARGFSDRWWLAPALALVTAGLYALTLPGSLMMLVVGILLPPISAATVFVTGGVAGAWGAFALARLARATGGSGGRKEDAGRLLGILATRSDFLTLLAVRVAPGLPHSAINVAAGLLKLPSRTFLASTALGLSIKGTLIITAVHEASRATSIEEAVSWRTVAPLAVLSLLLLVAPPLLRRLRVNRPAPGAE